METKTFKEYRSNYPTINYDDWKKRFPLYHDMMEEFHSKFDDIPKEQVSTGGTYSWYRKIALFITKFKPKHIIEYGPGFSTYLISKVIKDLDYNIKFTSYEDRPQYYNYIKEYGMDPLNVVELVDYQITVKDDLYYFEYLHDYEKHKDVDCIFIDGPGKLTVYDKYKPNINLNLEKFIRKLNKPILHTIDGRHDTAVYYKRLYKELGYEY